MRLSAARRRKQRHYLGRDVALFNARRLSGHAPKIGAGAPPPHWAIDHQRTAAAAVVIFNWFLLCAFVCVVVAAAAVALGGCWGRHPTSGLGDLATSRSATAAMGKSHGSRTSRRSGGSYRTERTVQAGDPRSGVVHRCSCSPLRRRPAPFPAPHGPTTHGGAIMRSSTRRLLRRGAFSGSGQRRCTRAAKIGQRGHHSRKRGHGSSEMPDSLGNTRLLCLHRRSGLIF